MKVINAEGCMNDSNDHRVCDLSTAQSAAETIT